MKVIDWISILMESKFPKICTSDIDVIYLPQSERNKAPEILLFVLVHVDLDNKLCDIETLWLLMCR